LSGFININFTFLFKLDRTFNFYDAVNIHTHTRISYQCMRFLSYSLFFCQIFIFLLLFLFCYLNRKNSASKVKEYASSCEVTRFNAVALCNFPRFSHGSIFNSFPSAEKFFSMFLMKNLKHKSCKIPGKNSVELKRKASKIILSCTCVEVNENVKGKVFATREKSQTMFTFIYRCVGSTFFTHTFEKGNKKKISFLLPEGDFPFSRFLLFRCVVRFRQ
jgi:hypothetical protein